MHYKRSGEMLLYHFLQQWLLNLTI